MYKKYLILIISLLTFAGVNVQPCKALSAIPQNYDNMTVETADEDSENQETDRIQRVSFRDKFKKSPETQINNFFKKYTKYSIKGDNEKLKELYSENYVNNDGFDKTTVFKMMEAAGEVYKDVKYNIEVQNISVDGNSAIVKVHEKATGVTTKPMPRMGDNGIINSDIFYIDYLQKEGTDWKITNSNVLSEKVELKYGEAKNSVLDIKAPECVTAGAEYEISVNTTTPDGVFVVGSIVNDPIVFPQRQNKDVYRALKNDALARVIKANTDGNNEYATVTLAITRAKVEPAAVVINMTGMAFAMKRVNVFALKNNIKTEEDVNGSAKKSSKEISKRG